MSSHAAVLRVSFTRDRGHDVLGRVKQAACIKEKDVAKNFGGNWGYLRARPDECKPRAFETRLVKYFDKGSLLSGTYGHPRQKSLPRTSAIDHISAVYRIL